MICKIVQNGGFIYMILCTLIIVIDSSHFERIQTIQEFCSSSNYFSRIEPGENYQLKLISQSPLRINKWYHKYKRKCYKEFKTDDAASHITLIISNMTVPSCSEQCQCNYFEVSVPGDGYPSKYCGEKKSDLYFTSKSDHLFILFHHPDQSMTFNVTLTFIAERNAYIITGEPDESDLRFGHFIETPYFPLPHPSNYKVEYVLQSNNMTGHVMLLFLDFLITEDSFIEVVGHNGTHPARFYGDLFRPPIIISQSHRLEFKFEANNQHGRPGFRVLYSFVKNSSEIQNTITDCGGLESARGGAIKLHSNERRLYDCIWRVMPLILQYSIKFYLSVSVLSLQNAGPKAFLEFREGLFSKSKLVKLIDCETSDCSQVLEEVTVLASNGLYIRFSGYLEAESHISMAYSTYHAKNCSDIEKLCLNERCLPPDLLCDGVNHCPDGSDEQFCLSTEHTTSEKVLTSPPIRKERLHKNNIEAAFIVILVFGTCGIIASVLVFFIGYRIYKSAYTTTVQETPPPEIISTVTGAQTRLCARPTSRYDLPPSYDDFMKSADQYPPLLFTRAKRFSEPYNNYNPAQHTTSFCANGRQRHHSAHSFVDLGGSNYSNNMSFQKSDVNDTSFVSQPSCSFHESNMEWTVENAVLKSPKHGIKRSNSLDSKLNEMLNYSTCHFFLSIIHPKCPHMPNQCAQFQCHTLPANFKMRDYKSCEKSANFEFFSECGSWLPKSRHQDFSKRRHLSWSITPHVSSNNSEVLTTVKTRCHSDPCKKVIVHCALYP